MRGLVLDLFPGLELLGRAFRETGFCVVSGPDKLWGDDVRDFHPPAGRFDGVIGGSPCQAFSALANLVRAKGLEPRFGNLIPEFERVVREARPLWFLHENVPAAPIPRPRGYDVRDFLLCNSSIPGEDGLGQEQERRPGSSPRRSLADMLRLQVLPENLLADAPFTAKAKRKLVANGVPMPLGRAVARAVVKALEELAGSVDAAAAGAVEYEDGPGCVVRGPL